MSHDAITEPEQAAKALRQERDFIAAVLDTVGALVIVLDRQGRIVRFNQACVHTTGYAAAEVLGKSVWELFLPPEEREAAKETFHQLLTGHFPLEHETYMVANDGSRRLIAWTNTTILGDDGEVVYVIGTGPDITAQKQAQVEIASLSKFPAENPNPVLRLDRDGTLLYANPSSQPLLDLWDAEIGQTLPEDWRQLIRESLSTGRSKKIELPCGEAVYSLTLTPIADMDYVNIYGEDIIERKRAEARLQEQPAFQQMLLDTVPIPIFYKDVHGRYQGCNTAFEQFYGMRREEVIGKSVYDVAPKEIADVYLEKDLELLEKPGKQEYEFVVKDAAGNLRKVIFHKATFPNPDGSVGGIIGAILDITELKKTEKELRQAQRDWEEIFQAIGHSTMILDTEHNVILANRSALAATGLSEAEMRGKKCQEIFHGSHQPPEGCPLEQWLESGHLETMAMEVETLGGVFLLSCTPVLDEAGRLQKVIHIATDITTLKRAEEELFKNHLELQETAQRLEQSRNMLQLIIESIPVRVFWKDSDLRFLGCNTLFALDAGFNHPQQLLGKDDFAMGWREHAHPYRMDDRQVMESLRPKMNMVEPQTTPAGTKIWLKTSKVPLQMPDGEVFGVLGVYEDITTQKQAEEALRESEKLYRSLFENMLNGFAYCKVLFDQNQPQDFIYLEVNSSFEVLTGFKNVVGEKASELFPGLRESDPELIATYGRVALTGKPERLEIYVEAIKMWLSISLYSPEKEYFVAVFDVITERKQAEEALRKTTEALEAVIQASPLAIFVLDAEGRVQMWNPASERIFGWTAEESVGQVLPIVPEEKLPEFRGLLQRCLEGESLSDVEQRRRRKDGSPIDIRIYTAPLYDPQDRVTGIMALNADITEQKQAQEALKKSEATLKSIFLAAPIGIGLSVKRVIMEVNDQLCSLTGYTREELLGQSASMFYPSDIDYEAAKHKLYGQMQETGIGTLETGWRRKDGGIIEVLLGSSLLMVDDLDSGVTFTALDITERKRAREELFREKEKYRVLAEESPLGVAIIGQDGNFKYLNPKFMEIFGYTLTDLPTEKEWFARAFPDAVYRRQVISEWSGDLKESEPGESRSGTFTVTCEDGLEKIIHFLSASLVNRDKLIIYEDITERTRAEAAFESLVTHAPIGIYIVQEGKFRLINPGFEKITGYRVSDLIGEEALTIVAPEFREKVRQKTIEMLRGKRFTPYEYQFLNKHGGRGWVIERVTPTEFEGKKATLGYFMDTTECRQAEAALERLRLQNELILNSAGEGIFGLDSQGKVTFINAAAAHTLGYEPPDLIDQDIHSLIHYTKPDGTPHPKEDCPAYATLKNGEVRRVLEDVFWTKEGRSFPVEYVITPIQEGGKITGVVNVFRDVSERKKLESKFIQAQKMEAVGRLAGGVAHDFNNMLGAIIGYADMMLMAIHKDDPIGRQAEGIKKAADRAVSLTRQLLAFSRQQVLHPQVLDLNAVVTDMENMLQRLLGEDIDMTLSLDPELAAVKADLGQMEQVVMNLAVNARDAMPQGGKITIETANVFLNGTYSQKYCYLNHGPYVLLVVSDHGVGMDPETKAHIFEPFYTTKELGRGTGLGLSIVYGIVNQSNGYIEVYSEPGAGTTFKVYLPRVEEAVAPLKEAAAPTMELEGRETILVVEDEEMLQELIVEVLEQYGYQVLAARHGGEALLLCERHPGPIQLMVTDVMMAQMSGWELAERLAPLRPQMKVLYMSGYTGDALLQPGVSEEELPLLEKPFSPMALVRRVREMLDASRD